MSSASSVVTYTSVYSDSEPGRVFWGAEDELSDGGSPRVIVYGYDGLPMQPAHDPNYVPEPIYPEYIPLEDEHVFLVEEQPLPPVVSPTAESPGYVVKSDPKEDPKETEDGPVNYPMNEGDDRDDDDGDSSRDDTDDKDEDKEDEDEEDEEEDEHLAPANSVVVVPTVKLVSLPEGTKPVIPPPSTDISTTGAKTTVRLQASISLPPEAKSALLGARPYLHFHHHYLCHHHYYHHLGVQPKSRHLLPPSLYLPPPINRRDDIPESKQPPRKRSCLFALGSRYKIRESSTARPTGDPAEAVPEIAPMTMGEVNTRVTGLADLHKHDTQDLYALLEDAQDGDSMDCGGGGLCFPKGLGSLDKIESGDPLGASDLP
ncbi:hypothetical protein Tco_0845885 [Tanacetum coccineum]